MNNYPNEQNKHSQYTPPQGSPVRGTNSEIHSEGYVRPEGYHVAEADAAQNGTAPSGMPQNDTAQSDTNFAKHAGIHYTAPSGGAWQPAPPKRKHKGPRVLALLLACLVCGFGGGVAAVSVMGTANQTVIYRAISSNNAAVGVSQSGELTVSDIAQQAGQSVVSITTENMVLDGMASGQIVSGAGSGVIISEDGVILTNDHVIDQAQNVQVTLADGRVYEAEIVGSDPASDIAVLKIDETGLVPALVGDSDALVVGEFCLAIGNPLGQLSGTVTDGIISALERRVTFDEHTMTLLQMSAAVSPGNSGGGLFNARGELVGIVNSKLDSEDAEGLGFAVPINTAMDVAEQILTTGEVVRPGIGVMLVNPTSKEQAQAYGYQDAGIYILEVEQNSPAEQAGLQVEDRIIAADGVEVGFTDEIAVIIAEKEVGDNLQLTILRDGEEMDIDITLGRLD